MDEELRKALEELEARIAAAQEERHKEYQQKLDSLQERDTDINDQKVKDLEAYMLERDEQIKTLQEELRLLKANPLVPDDGQSRNVGKPDFTGCFFKDIDAVRAMIKPGETRQIDTALLAAGGQMPIDVADAFIDLVVEQQPTLSRITTRRMNSNTAALDELRVAARQMIAATEATAPALADSVTTARHTLTTVEVILAEDITLSFIEDNIEKAGVENHIAQILARQFGTDLNDLALNGDTTTGTFLVINNGFSVLFQADADVVDTDLTGILTAVGCLSAMMADIPQNIIGRTDIGYIAPVGFCQAYANEFAARETSAGDQVFLGGFPALRYFGRPVIPDPHMSEATAGIATQQKIILAPLLTLVNGIQRNFRLDSFWNARTRCVEYTLTARTDAEYVSGEAVVLGDALDATLQ